MKCIELYITNLIRSVITETLENVHTSDVLTAAIDLLDFHIHFVGTYSHI